MGTWCPAWRAPARASFLVSWTYGPIWNCLGEGESPSGSTSPHHVPSPALVLGGLAAQLCPQLSDYPCVETWGLAGAVGTSPTISFTDRDAETQRG